MKLTVFAATGRIGQALVDQALAAGHDVTAVARDPSRVVPGVRVVTADLAEADPTLLEPAVAGADAVLSGLGPRSRADAGVTAPGTRAIVAAMRAVGARRLLVVSAAPLSTIPTRTNPRPGRDPGETPLLRYLLTPMVKRVLRDHYADLGLMEDMLRDSDLEWTSVRPPRLVDRAVTGVYRTALDASPKGGMSISRADVAHAMLAMVDREDTLRRAVGVAW